MHCSSRWSTRIYFSSDEINVFLKTPINHCWFVYNVELSRFNLSLHFQDFCYHLPFIILGNFLKILFFSNVFELCFCFLSCVANGLPAQPSHAYLLGLGSLNVLLQKATMNWKSYIRHTQMKTMIRYCLLTVSTSYGEFART